MRMYVHKNSPLTQYILPNFYCRKRFHCLKEFASKISICQKNYYNNKLNSLQQNIVILGETFLKLYRMVFM